MNNQEQENQRKIEFNKAILAEKRNFDARTHLHDLRQDYKIKPQK
jgi:hypothetical protein